MDANMQAAIADAVKAALAGQAILKADKPKVKKAKGAAKKGGRKPLTDAEKAVFIAQNDAACLAAFTAAGYKDVQPRINVLTYRKWFEKGRIVKKGTKATRVGPFNLFHEVDTEAAPAIIGA